MPQMSLLRECAIGMLTAGMSTRAVAKEFNVLQGNFIEFVNLSNQPHNRTPHVLCRVGKQFANVNIVNGVPHDGGGVMVRADRHKL